MNIFTARRRWWSVEVVRRSVECERLSVDGARLSYDWMRRGCLTTRYTSCHEVFPRPLEKALPLSHDLKPLQAHEAQRGIIALPTPTNDDTSEIWQSLITRARRQGGEGGFLDSTPATDGGQTKHGETLRKNLEKNLKKS